MPAFIALFLGTVLFLLGLAAGLSSGFKNGATAQKNGQITWHTNVSFTVNK